MIKMVSSDLDGTLLTGGSQTIPEEIFSLIKELKDMATGIIESNENDGVAKYLQKISISKPTVL